ncbi:MAG: hypothetical protein V4638_01150 [Bacteroidota bacterium]
MFRKVVIIVFLAGLLAGFLILRPYLFKKEAPPNLEDRLPEGDVIGKAYLLDVARETKGMLYHHKIPFRDLFAPEFILSQSKNYGLNIQKPIYFFANENGEWGSLVSVSDSSKILQGIIRLKKVIAIKDTMVNDLKMYYSKKENSYLYYDKSYLLLYHGADVKIIFKRVTAAKNGDVSPVWKAFLKEKQFKDDRLVIYTNWPKMRENGVDVAMFAHDSDSSSFFLKTYIRGRDSLHLSIKAPGKGFVPDMQGSKVVNIHLDVSEFKKYPNDPIYKLFAKAGKRISFPTIDFLNAWTGDLSFREGGTQTVKETYIESELDDNFNVTEVTKTKEVLVPGYSMLFSSNQKGNYFISRLMGKGILTYENPKYRFLYSPPLAMNKMNDYYVFQSGEKIPKIVKSNANNGVWNHKGTRYEFNLDSIAGKEAFGSLKIPVQKIISGSPLF